MQIDPNAVQWDEDPIDPAQVQWDSGPAKPKPKVPARLSAQEAARAKRIVYGGGPAQDALDFFRAGAHHVGNAVLGTGQLIHKGVTAAAQAVLPAPEQNLSGLITGRQATATGPMQRLRQGIEDIDQRAPAHLAKREADYQAQVPTNGASIAGAVAGEVAPWLVGVGELRALGMLPKITAGGVKGVAQKGGLLALEGGAYGAMQPVMGDGSYAAQKGAQVGLGALVNPAGVGATVLAGKGLAGLVGASRYITPSGRNALADERLAGLYGSDANVIQQLRTGTSVAGFDLTPAQALKNPRAVQAERVLRNNGETAPAFAEREAANDAAVQAQAARLAGTDADMAAAAQARRDGPGAFWKENMPRGAENNRYAKAADHLSDYMASRSMPRSEHDVLDEARKIAGQVQRGSVSQAEGDAAIRALQPKSRAAQKALDQALGMVDNGMVNPSRIIAHLQELSKDTNKTISGAANDAIASLAKNQDGQGWVHGRVLDGLRQNLGTLLQHNTAPNAAVGTKEGAALGPLKAKITNAVERAIPGYRANLAAYASASQPINDMEAGRALLAAIGGNTRNSSGGQSVSLSQVRALLAKDNRADFPMSDGARKQIEAVLDALQDRSVTSNTVAAAGPGTAADVQRAIQNSPLLIRLLTQTAGFAGGTALGSPALGYFAGAAAGEGANALNNNILRQLGQKASSARATADALEAHRMRNPPKSQSILDMLLPYEQRALPPPR